MGRQVMGRQVMGRQVMGRQVIVYDLVIFIHNVSWNLLVQYLSEDSGLRRYRRVSNPHSGGVHLPQPPMSVLGCGYFARC